MNAKPVLQRAVVLLLCALISACATAPRDQAEPSDPLEPINRKIYAFNDFFDGYVAKPVAEGYNKVTPGPVNRAISNFFSNLGDVVVLVNSALQLKGHATGITAQRLLLNTTFGVFGLMDVASDAGKPKQNEDFGQTLGYWGLAPGPYLVLPILGPSNLRDGSGLLVDHQYEPISQVDGRELRYSARALKGIDTRARLLGATNILSTAAVDPYTYTRSAYLNRRASLVRDGKPAPSDEPDEEDQSGFDPFSDEDDDLFNQSTDNQSSGDSGNRSTGTPPAGD